tara:strand:+ start:785 stop:2113 length:1329 start_codon:yes stop_codon:yes gene_type:complete
MQTLNRQFRAARFGRHAMLGLLPLLLLISQPGAAAPHILVDMETGRILEQKDALLPWYPASVTKLMTAFVTFEAIAAGDLTMRSAVIMSRNALNEPPSKMGFAVGTEVTVENALKMLIVKSANDIAVALAEAVGGSEQKFVARMNATAARLGMTGTRFRNPNGLPAKGQTTNARDMAVLTQAIFKQYPQHGDLFKITAIRAGKRVLKSYNPLLTRYQGATGMKTGFICSSGFNMVATANRGGRDLIAVVFGAPSSQERAETAAQLLDKGFRSSGQSSQKSVADYKARGLTAEPMDMRSQICSKAARSERAKFRKSYKMGEGISVLSNVDLVETIPVAVRTGGAIRTISAALRNAPTPVPRPDVVLAAVPDPADDTTVEGSATEVADQMEGAADQVDTGDGDGDEARVSSQSAQSAPSAQSALGGIPLPADRPAFAKTAKPVN